MMNFSVSLKCNYHAYSSLELVGAMKGRSGRAGRTVRKRKRKREQSVRSGRKRVTAVNWFITETETLFISLWCSSLSKSSAAVHQPDEVSPPERIQLNAAAACSVLWYSWLLDEVLFYFTYLKESFRNVFTCCLQWCNLTVCVCFHCFHSDTGRGLQTLQTIMVLF